MVWWFCFVVFSLTENWAWNVGKMLVVRLPLILPPSNLSLGLVPRDQIITLCVKHPFFLEIWRYFSMTHEFSPFPKGLLFSISMVFTARVFLMLAFVCSKKLTDKALQVSWWLQNSAWHPFYACTFIIRNPSELGAGRPNQRIAFNPLRVQRSFI